MENGADTAPHGDAARPRMSLLSAKRKHQSVEPKAKTQRWRTSQQAEDYMSLVADMMAPSVTFGAYGYDHEQGEYPLEQPNTLGVLLCPVRRPSVIEKWSPFEIAVFEGAIFLHGKCFHTLQKFIKTKTTKEVIEFYYIWKKTSHYDQWKEKFVPDVLLDSDSAEGEGDDEVGDGEADMSGGAVAPSRKVKSRRRR